MKTGGRSIVSSFQHYHHHTECDENCQTYLPQFDQYYCSLYLQYFKKRPKYIRQDHIPFYNAQKFVPTYDYTITVIRDPLERLLSHYRMLLLHRTTSWSGESDNPKWVNKGIDFFIEKFPVMYKIHQLSFFSPTLNVDEALDNIKKTTQIILTENMQEGLDKFSIKTDIKLKECRTGVSKIQVHDIDKKYVDKMKKLLSLEYLFYEKVLNYYYK
tara:strand:- start:642 stop:1283 length:642 start_codon:yes stop_codon:yes gene_type:complete